MKFFALIGLLCASLALASCGGDDSTGATTQSTATSGESSTTSNEAKGDESTKPDLLKTPKRPRVSVPSGPPPDHVVIRDIKKGTGKVLKNGEEFSVRYVAFDYKNGEVLEDRWSKGAIFSWTFGPGEVVKAWVPGLQGMRVGGRRELRAPARLAYGNGVAEIWVVELLAVGETLD